MTGLSEGAYSQALSHYCQARALLPAAFLPWAGSNLTIYTTWAHKASATTSMLMLDLVRAPARHRTPTSRNPGLKPSTRSCPGSSSSYSHAPPGPASSLAQFQPFIRRPDARASLYSTAMQWRMALATIVYQIVCSRAAFLLSSPSRKRADIQLSPSHDQTQA